MYHLAIVEDDELDRKIICDMCGEILDEMEVEYQIGTFSDARTMEASLERGEAYDLICLDIYMDEKDGMELAHSLRNRDDHTSILFITNSQEHLKEGYRVRPLEYLYKPLQKSELEDALKTDLRLNHRPKSIILNQGTNTMVLQLDEIVYFESRNHDALVYLKETSRQYRVSLSELEQLLPADQFCRCHNSYLVNIDHIVKISRNGMELDNGMHVPVGRRYYKEAQTKIVRYHNQRK